MASFPFQAKAILRWSSPELSFEESTVLTVLGDGPQDAQGSYEAEDADGNKGEFPKESVVPVEDPTSTPAPTKEDASAAALAEPVEPIAIPERSPSTQSIPVNSVPDALSPVAVVSSLPVAFTEDKPVEVATKEAEKEEKGGLSAKGEDKVTPVAEETTTISPPPTSKPAPSSSSTGAVKVGTMSTSDAQASIKAGGSLKERMAMFQQQSASSSSSASSQAPPPPRAKPANWSWKNKVDTSPSSSTVGEKPAEGTMTSSSSTTAASTASPPRPGAFSASDAQTSIKSGGSLKERMALLQGQMASAAAPSAGGPPPVPGGKPRVWKRPEAPPAVMSSAAPVERKESKWKVDIEESKGERPVVSSGEAAPAAEEGETKEGEEVKEEGEGGAKEGGDEEVEHEDDEEAAEKARRAAIAARMAKLGGRGMFAPPVVPPKRQPSTESKPTSSPQPSPASEDAPPVASPSQDSPSTTTADLSAPAAPAPMLAVPKRAAPPRRKQPTPQSSVGPPSTEPIPSAPNPDEVPVPKTAAELEDVARAEEAGRGAQGVEGAQEAGIALAAVGEGQQAVDQPLVGEKHSSAGTDVPRLEEGQVELSKVDPEVEHHEATLVAEPEEVFCSTPAEEKKEEEEEVAQDARGRRPSIPLPERDSSHHEETAVFRQPISTPSQLGPPRGPILSASAPSTAGESTPANADKAQDDDEEAKLFTDDKRKQELLAETPFPKTGDIVPLPAVELTGPAQEDDDEKDADKGSQTTGDDNDAEDDTPPSLPPGRPRTSLPPPPPAAPSSSEDDEEEEQEEGEDEEIPSEAEGPAVVHESDDRDTLPPPPPPARTLPRPAAPDLDVQTRESSVFEEEGGLSAEEGQEEDVAGDEEEAVGVVAHSQSEMGEDTPPPPPARLSAGLPPPPPPVEDEAQEPETDAEEAADAEDADTDVEDAPPPPPARPSVPAPAQATGDNITSTPPAKRNSLMPAIPAPRIQTPADEFQKSFFEKEIEEKKEPETVPVQPQSEEEMAEPPTEDKAEPSEEDAEAARRQTIAARMAKLGGIRAFGGPPIPVARKPTAESSVEASPVEPKDSFNETAGEPEEEEDDEARRARARAKMAAIGVRGFSMFGGTAAPVAPPPPAVEAEKEPEPVEEDGKAEVNDVQQEQLEEETVEEYDASPDSVPEGVDEDEDEAPPPPPRKPSTLPPPPPAVQDLSASADDDPAIVADEPESYEEGADEFEDAPPPPPRPSRGAPPVIDTHVSEEPSSISSPVGETPGSPLSRRASKGLSGMFKSRSSMDASRPPTSPAGDVSEHAPPSPARKDSTQVDLGALSKQTGTAVHRNADSLVLQSKKAYIADGTSLGFVQEALYMSHCKPFEEGARIYHQTNGTIRERRDDIQPGDIIEMSNCHFKGKKALTSYTQDVELGHGVVLEFEAKKGKLHVAQAATKQNHYPTLESVTYRLEDLKTGEVSIYRAVPGTA